MIYPLVGELAVDGLPVTATCRVLELARQPYYRWLAAPVTPSELVTAYRANALFDAHREPALYSRTIRSLPAVDGPGRPPPVRGRSAHLDEPPGSASADERHD